MAKRMLIDATHKEETRIAITDGNKLIEYDYESQSRKPLKGSIFLAKVTRVEPSLQAAFVNFGGNRHGFLPFSEIHPDYFRIPVSDREALMAEQEELLKQHDDEEAEDEAEADDVVEAEGADSTDVEEVEVEVEADAAPEAEGNSDEDDEVKASDVDGNVAEDKASDAENASGEDNSGRHKKRGVRGRGRGRGGRAQKRNSSVEVVGGEEIDEAQRFRFNLRRKYKIQEVIKRGQIMLVQVNKEERGNKGAAVGSYLSLPGRYCVLMPNSPRAGGVSRKIANHKDRARMRDIVKDLEVPKGMSVIVRTAGVTRTKVEIKRDLDYLMRLWDTIRDLTLESTAPAMVYEEADLIKRAVRDLYTRDVEEILVSGDAGYQTAKSFMKMMIPSHVKKVVQYDNDALPLFHRYQLESQIDEIGMTEVRLKSGGYLVINPTEALVSVDVNSGKATKGRHIEETALKTNLEAADEVARQLKLRDLGGLVVIDFIDMEERRNNGKVERRMKEALSGDRARVQVGRISSFGLMELSRQRLSPSLTEAQYEKCNTCNGLGLIRTDDAMSIVVLRAIEEEGIRARAAQIIVQVTGSVALYILNHKRRKMAQIEERYGLQVLLRIDDNIPASEYRVEVSKPVDTDADTSGSSSAGDGSNSSVDASSDDGENTGNRKRRGRRGGRNRNGRQDRDRSQNDDANASSDNDKVESVAEVDAKPVVEKDAKAEAVEPSKEEKPKRQSRRRKKADDAPKIEESADGNVAANDKGADDVPAATEEKPKKKPVRKRAPKKVEEKAEAAQAPEEDPKPAPKKARASKPKVAEKKPVDEEPKDYETVNQAPERKKKGWWNRL